MVDYETETDPDLKEALELSLTIRLSKEEDAAAATDTKDEHYKPHENFGTNKHITEEDEEPQGRKKKSDFLRRLFVNNTNSACR
jgi:hypothetical protein